MKGLPEGTLSTLTLIASEGGVFEVLVDGELIHSKTETGRFPPAGAILEKLKQRVI
ncbi:MAG: SelT/SelW/SelH family protein [Chloroflexi bacterium]|nr:SelT/SelW/SelH family protein [Chloroflexota bacterium]